MINELPNQYHYLDGEEEDRVRTATIEIIKQYPEFALYLGRALSTNPAFARGFLLRTEPTDPRIAGARILRSLEQFCKSVDIDLTMAPTIKEIGDLILRERELQLPTRYEDIRFAMGDPGVQFITGTLASGVTTLLQATLSKYKHQGDVLYIDIQDAQSNEHAFETILWEVSKPGGINIDDLPAVNGPTSSFEMARNAIHGILKYASLRHGPTVVAIDGHFDRSGLLLSLAEIYAKFEKNRQFFGAEKFPGDVGLSIVLSCDRRIEKLLPTHRGVRTSTVPWFGRSEVIQMAAEIKTDGADWMFGDPERKFLGLSAWEWFRGQPQLTDEYLRSRIGKGQWTHDDARYVMSHLNPIAEDNVELFHHLHRLASELDRNFLPRTKMDHGPRELVELGIVDGKGEFTCPFYGVFLPAMQAEVLRVGPWAELKSDESCVNLDYPGISRNRYSGHLVLDAPALRPLRNLERTL